MYVPKSDRRHAPILVSVEAEKQCDEPDYGNPDREDEGRCKHEGPDARITRDGSSGATSPSFDRVRPRAPLRILLELPDDIRLTVSLLRHSRSVGRPFAPRARASIGPPIEG
jgi:hypothetical protein